MRRGIFLGFIIVFLGGFLYFSENAAGEGRVNGRLEQEETEDIRNSQQNNNIEENNEIIEAEEGIELTGDSEIKEGNLVINEFLPNPDSGNEWVEVFNKTNNDFDLSECEIRDEKNNEFGDFAGINIDGDGYAVLEDTNVLNNSGGDKVILKCNDEVIDEVGYGSSGEAMLPGKGEALARIPNGEDTNNDKNDFQITAEPTKGGENKEKENHAPVAEAGSDQEVFVGDEVLFNGEGSSDSDGDDLTFSWDFKDGERGSGQEVSHIYSAAGTYVVTLTVSDGKEEATDTLSVVVKEKTYSDKIVINEILPDPEGDDAKGEFIELFNTGSEDIDLKDWFLDDAEGGSRAYKIREEEIIKGGAYAVFYRSETKIALNNTSDKARLIKPNGVLADEIVYEKSYTAASYNRTNGEWKWSKKITPGSPNEIEELDEDEEEEIEIDEEAKEMSILEAKKQDIGAFVGIEGIVSALPGVFSEYYFYLSGSGIQIYFSKGDFSTLKLGDKISLKGFVSKFGNEARIRITDKDNIKILKHGEKIEAHKIKTGEIGEKWEGSLVEVSAEVIKKQGSSFYINDGSGEARVYIDEDTDIDKSEIKKGDFVVIIGIVSETSSGYRILPRFQEDIKIVKGASTAAAVEKKVKGSAKKKLPATGGNIFEPILAGFISSVLVVYRKRII